jgi:general secretion pathway protein D
MTRIILSTLVLLLALSPLLAQEPGPEAPPAAPPAVDDPEAIIQITPKQGGWDVEELFRTISEYTGQSIVYDPANPQIRQKKIEFVGVQRVPRGKLFDWFQSLLSFQRLILVPVGPSGHEQWMALDLNAAQITNRPIFVSEDRLEEWEDRDGVYIVSTITTKFLTDTSRARNALAQMATRQIGRINDVPGNLAFIVGDFAPVVVSMYRLLRAMDVEPMEYSPVAETYLLKWAVASEMEPLLIDLLQSDDQARAQRRAAQPGVPEKPDPKIIADTRQDAIIVYAVPEDQARISGLIALLDQEVQYKRGNIHIRPIRHTSASDLADLLTELIRGAGVGRRTSGTTRPTRPGTQGGPQGGQITGNEEEPIIVADDRSNSLLIQATATQMLDLDELIEKIDVARDQVLVEAALIELSVDDLLRFGVEMVSAATKDRLEDDSYFGGTQFGLSTITDTDGDGIPDINIPIIGQGLNAGIFNNDYFPFLLQALQTDGRAQALSMPSVVVEDGSQATMTVSDEEPYSIRSTDTGGNTNFSVDFTEAEISLDISPHISSDNYLRLHIVQKVQSFGTRASEDLPPPKTGRELETDIVVPNGYTVVMGGLIDEKKQEADSGIPYLRDIPILGYLFGARRETSSKTSLFLFVTPRILRQGPKNDFADYHRETWERKLLADELLERAVAIPSARFKGAEDEAAISELERIQESGWLDMPRYKGTARKAMDAEEAMDRFEEIRRAKEAGK